jgi:hypothetical protein
MKDDYKFNEPSVSLNVMIEKSVAFQLQQMTEYSKFTADELVNTALKRFIAGHKDFLPASE